MKLTDKLTWLFKRKPKRLNRFELLEHMIQHATHVEFDRNIYPIEKDQNGGFKFYAEGRYFKSMTPLHENFNYNYGSCYDMMVDYDKYEDDIQVKFLSMVSTNRVWNEPVLDKEHGNAPLPIAVVPKLKKIKRVSVSEHRAWE